MLWGKSVNEGREYEVRNDNLCRCHHDAKRIVVISLKNYVTLDVVVVMCAWKQIWFHYFCDRGNFRLCWRLIYFVANDTFVGCRCAKMWSMFLTSYLILYHLLQVYSQSLFKAPIVNTSFSVKCHRHSISYFTEEADAPHVSQINCILSKSNPCTRPIQVLLKKTV